MAMKKTKTLESLTADTILQRVQSITIGGKEYLVAPPTLATLILVSEAVSYLPNFTMPQGDAIHAALRDARHYRGLAEVAAILILGAKRLAVEEEYHETYFGMFKRKKTRIVDMKSRIADELMHVELAELSQAVATLLSLMQVEHFFAIATFLTNINLTKQTKVAKTTASGQ